MAVKSRSLGGSNDGQTKQRRGGRGIRWRGCIPGSVMAVLVEVLIPIIAVLLIVLSVLGTFYGARGKPVPITDPLAIWRDISAAAMPFLLACGGQAVLAVAQWGGRHAARADRRWWGLYVASLALSAWWNWKGYGPPLIGLGVPWLLAAGLIVAGDVVPELALVREDASG